MKIILSLCILAIPFVSCHKDSENNKSCDMAKVLEDNAKKATVTNGIWGTVAFMEGNCMPVILPSANSCKTCPVKRTVKIYESTQVNQATPQNFGGFYDSFSTQLIKEFDTDNDGFFQTAIAPGQYTIVVVENGQLYTFGTGNSGTLSPLTVTGGKENINLTLNYKASF
jgi:hypothetical protein